MTETQQVEQNAPAKKYELTDETTKSWDGRTLYRIRALVAIASIDVAAGDLGGFIEAEKNLTQSGNASVSGDASVSGNAEIHLPTHIGWHSHVGSENGTLTWFRTQNGGIYVNRGCFSGTLSDFEGAVQKTHGGNQTAQEYGLLVQFIKLRASAWVSEKKDAA
ncbi:hypothetical protein JK165_08730 [Acetobacter okinawensis]|uniref:hypothetical protein n=1 Tax=Acetobacter okinawensis TaxID=1076594 RepID=UPI001BAC4981|nr:hypothetical protein [Acetobacter okinawensis]MBS0966169.1 hypothetical protein [Acetobacter okinawensis]